MSFVISSESFDSLSAFAQKEITPHRIDHSIRCGSTLFRILPSFGLRNAIFLGLAHDICHSWSEERLRDEIKKGGVELYDGEENPLLLHGPAASVLLRTLCPDMPSEWLSAVRQHTVPAVEASQLTLALFVADVIEPGRPFVTEEFYKDVIENHSIDEMFLIVIDEQRRFFQEKFSSDILSVTKALRAEVAERVANERR